MKTRTQELAQVSMKLGQAIYEKEQQAAASPSGEGAASEGAGRMWSTPEFSEVDEDNKG